MATNTPGIGMSDALFEQALQEFGRVLAEGTVSRESVIGVLRRLDPSTLRALRSASRYSHILAVPFISHIFRGNATAAYLAKEAIEAYAGAFADGLEGIENPTPEQVGRAQSTAEETAWQSMMRRHEDTERAALAEEAVYASFGENAERVRRWEAYARLILRRAAEGGNAQAGRVLDRVRVSSREDKLRLVDALAIVPPGPNQEEEQVRSLIGALLYIDESEDATLGTFQRIFSRLTGEEHGSAGNRTGARVLRRGWDWVRPNALPFLRTEAVVMALALVAWVGIFALGVVQAHAAAAAGNIWAALWWRVGGFASTLIVLTAIPDVIQGHISLVNAIWKAAGEFLETIQSIATRLKDPKAVKKESWAEHFKSRARWYIELGADGLLFLASFFCLNFGAVGSKNLAAFIVIGGLTSAIIWHFVNDSEKVKASLLRMTLVPTSFIAYTLLTFALGRVWNKSQVEASLRVVSGVVDAVRYFTAGGVLALGVVALVGILIWGAMRAVSGRMVFGAVLAVLVAVLLLWRLQVRLDRLDGEREAAVVRASATPPSASRTPPRDEVEAAPTDAELKALGDAFDGI